MADDHERRRLIQVLRAEMTRSTGRAYRVDLEAFDVASLRELQRLLRDLGDERRAVVQRARLMPWRH